MDGFVPVALFWLNVSSKTLQYFIYNFLNEIRQDKQCVDSHLELNDGSCLKHL